MLPKGARSCCAKGGGLGRPRQRDVEARVRTEQFIELFIPLVKGVAGVKDAAANVEAEDGDWLTELGKAMSTSLKSLNFQYDWS